MTLNSSRCLLSSYLAYIYITQVYLGVLTIDISLRFLTSKVDLLCRLLNFLPQNYLITLYQTNIQSHTDYDLSIWEGSPISHIFPIQLLQNR